MRGQLTIRWEETASAAMGHVWFTDCDFSQHQTVDHKRPAIVLSALEQLIWDNRDDCDEEVDGSKVDYPRWIDTSAMLSDCLTKSMTSGGLNETLSTGIFDMRPTEESLAIKAKKQEVECVEERAGTVAGFRYFGESDSVLVQLPST